VGAEGERDALRARVDQLTDAQVAVVGRFLDAVTGKGDAVVDPDSWLASALWVEHFTARLLAYHANHDDPLSSTAFEAAFVAVSITVTWAATSNESARSLGIRFVMNTKLPSGVTAAKVGSRTALTRLISLLVSRSMTETS
jgi:hypothetical protein